MRFGRLAKESNSFYLLFNNESEMSWKLFENKKYVYKKEKKKNS